MDTLLKRPPKSYAAQTISTFPLPPPPDQFRSPCMHQQQPNGYNDGHAPDDAQQPTYGAHQGINAYPAATTRMVPNLEYVGHSEDTYRAYASTSHSCPRQMGPGMQIGAEGWAHQPLLDPTIPYHPQGAQRFFDFGSEEGQAYAALTYSSQAPDPSLQFPIAGRSPSTASWQVSGSRRFSSPAAPAPTVESHWPLASDHSLTYSNAVLYPQTSPLSSPSSTASGTYTELPIQPLGENFIQDSFPGESSEHDSLRLALTEVMNAPWKRQNEMEPDEDLLLQFQKYDKREGKWKCRFSHDGRTCQRSTIKKDHAKGHIRWHIDHRPYFCQDPCPAGDVDCTKRYTAMESLKKHQNGKADCEFCKTSMLRGNLQRHIASSCKGLVTPM